jgi:hypothetical protein
MQTESTIQQPAHDEIARLAYQIWEQRGCPPGYDVEFWLEAEHLIGFQQEATRGELPVASAQSPSLALTAPSAQSSAVVSLPRATKQNTARRSQADVPSLPASHRQNRPKQRASVGR